MPTGKTSTTLLLVAILVLVVCGVAWWFLRTSSSGRLRALDPGAITQGAPNQGAKGAVPGQDRVGASARFPGRRELSGAAAPDDVPVTALGSEQGIGDGHRVRLLDFEATLVASVEGAPRDLVVDIVRVEACAGDTEWSGGALAAAYHLAYPRPSGGFDQRPASSGLVVRKPALSTHLAGEVLSPGDCKKGWVVFALGTPDDFDGRLPTAILFDNTAFGFAEPSGRGRAAWRILE